MMRMTIVLSALLVWGCVSEAETEEIYGESDGETVGTRQDLVVTSFVSVVINLDEVCRKSPPAELELFLPPSADGPVIVDDIVYGDAPPNYLDRTVLWPGGTLQLEALHNLVAQELVLTAEGEDYGSAGASEARLGAIMISCPAEVDGSW